MLPPAATEFYATQQRVSLTARNEAARLWRRMGDDLDSSWRRIEGDVLAMVAEGQAQMALRARGYTERVLEDLEIPDRPEGDLIPESLAGVASDGRRLDTLAAQAVVKTKVAIGAGASIEQGLAEGGAWLQLMAALQVADAARVAVGIGAASRRDVAGHVRVLNLPVCQRCAILGGRFYRWSTGFDRHPGDDCTMMPVKSASQAEAYTSDPMDAYRSGQIKDLTGAQVRAIEDGADLGKVVNANRGISTTATEQRLSLRKVHLNEKAAKKAYEESLAKGHPDLLGQLRGLPRAQSELTRLTPEGIYQVAGSRAEAISLLRSGGYIT